MPGLGQEEGAPPGALRVGVRLLLALEQASELDLGGAVVQELAELRADRRQQVLDRRSGRSEAAAGELQHRDDPAAGPHGQRQRLERALPASAQPRLAARVREPGGALLRPGPARERDALGQDQLLGPLVQLVRGGCGDDAGALQPGRVARRRPQDARVPVEAAHQGRQHQRARLLEALGLGQRPRQAVLDEQAPLGEPALADVDGEASRVGESAVLGLRARVDQDVSDRAILAAQARLERAQRLPSRETGEHVAGDVGVDVELGDAPAHVLARRVAEERQLGRVGPQDRAVRCQPVDGDVVRVRVRWPSSIAHGPPSRQKQASSPGVFPRSMRS